jgi:hypothetical protein
MMRVLQSCVSKNILRIYPDQEQVIIALKSAKNKPSNTYSLDKTIFTYHDTLDALSLAQLKYIRPITNR